MPSLYLLYRLDGRTVIGQFLKLKIKLVVSSDELHFRRGASDDDELLGEDTFYDKSASIAGSVPGCNITTVRHEKKARRTDWNGRERTSESRHFSRLYLAS